MCIVKHKGQEKSKRVQVTFTAKQWELIEQFRGLLGNDDAEIVRNIVLSWLAEKSLIAGIVKQELRLGGSESGQDKV